MGFILDGLDTEDYDRQYNDRELLDRILGYFRPYRRQMILVAVMLTLNSAATIAGPILIAQAIDLLTVDTSNTGDSALNPGHRPLGCLRLGL